MKVMAHIHSQGGKEDEVTILYEKDNNNIVVLYHRNKYTAIFNPFVGAYYVDDLCGQTAENVE